MIDLIQGNSLHLPLADKSCQTCVTSPPYYGLRSYGIGTENGELGLEPTPEAYVANLVAVFREVKRVLADTGTVWIVIGDTYATHNSGGKGHPHNFRSPEVAEREGIIQVKPSPRSMGLKEKDLIGIPWMVAFALRADGWWLRRDIVWHKPNPMPESVDDRPTNSHEYIFLLSKSKDYYYDYTAILEPAAYDGRKDTRFKGSEKYKDSGQTFAERGHERWPKRLYPDGNNQLLHDYKHSGYFKDDGTPLFVMKDGIPMRNKRDVWTVNTAPYKEAHFATYPPALIKPCILAGTSEHGECPKCGAPWERVIDKPIPPKEVFTKTRKPEDGYVAGFTKEGKAVGCGQKLQNWLNEHPAQTIAWQPTCTCKEYACDTCDFVIEYSHDINITSDEVCQMWKDIPAQEKISEILQSDLLRGGVAPIIRQDMHTMRNNISPTKPRAESLREELCKQNRCGSETKYEGMVQDKERLHRDLYTKTSQFQQGGLCNGTSSSNGKGFTKTVNGKRNSASQERKQGRQQARELRSFGENIARHVEKANLYNNVSSMQTTISNARECPHCGGKLILRPFKPKPQIVLDIFSGAGTTGVVCQKLRRNYIGIDLSMDYLQMSRRWLGKKALADWGSRGAEAGGGLQGLPMFSKEEE